MQQRLGAARRGQARLGAARRGQALLGAARLLFFNPVTGQMHLGTFFPTRSQARCIQALLSKFLSNSRPYITFKPPRLFLEAVLLYISINTCITTPLQTLPFPFLLDILHSDTYHTCKRCITNASSEEAPMNFLIYHCITDFSYLTNNGSKNNFGPTNLLYLVLPVCCYTI